MFDCVAVLWFEASTQLPLFWLTSPPFRNATFLPLTTTGADDPRWFAVFSARLDWLADWDTSPLPEPQQPEPVVLPCGRDISTRFKEQAQFAQINPNTSHKSPPTHP